MILAVSYCGHIFTTMWRKKSTILGVVTCLVVLLLCLQYSSLSSKQDGGANVAEERSSALRKSPELLQKTKGKEGDRTLAARPGLPESHQLDRPQLEQSSTLKNDQKNTDSSKYRNVQFVSQEQWNRTGLKSEHGRQGIEEDHRNMGRPAPAPQDIGGGQEDTLSREDLVKKRKNLFLQYAESKKQNKMNLVHPNSVGASNIGQPGEVEFLSHRPGEHEGDTRYNANYDTDQKFPQQNGWDTYNAGYNHGLHQNGIPVVNLNPKNPYIPINRLVHLDFKGAPPKVEYLKKLFPLIKDLGATGVLLEWEDMFPFKRPLAHIAAKNHYSLKEIHRILDLASMYKLEVIPLVQTFGHLEFALKEEQFAHLREVPEMPAALCPSLNDSMLFVEKMIDQVMDAHRDARFLHIGCDEVYQIGECNRCRQEMRENLFLGHVGRVAHYVRRKYNVIPIIWDDMLRQIAPQTLEDFSIGKLVEPMVWVYAEDVYRFVPPNIWEKYANVFPYIWTASAFKGAFGETLYIPDVKRHLENNLKWLEVMTNEHYKFTGGMRGIVLTGWQRYDHFATLCELLPAAIPSLAVNLLAVSHGFFNQTLQRPLYKALGCVQTPKYESFLNLNQDPFLWDKVSWCFFPGTQFFKLTSRLGMVEREVEEYLTSVTVSKGWLTDYNIRHNYSLPSRVDEGMAEFSRTYHDVANLMKSAKEVLADVFDHYTIAEWVEQKVYPMIKKLDDLQKSSEELRSVSVWERRPLPPLPALRKFGIGLPEEEDDKRQMALLKPGKEEERKET